MRGQQMPKRFTATEKWDDPWFCELSNEARLFWIYILDQCDPAGIWQVNHFIVKAYFGAGFKIPDFGDRVIKISDTKWFVPKFLIFQYGYDWYNSPTFNATKSAVKILTALGILDRAIQATRALSLESINNSGPPQDLGKCNGNVNGNVISKDNKSFNVLYSAQSLLDAWNKDIPQGLAPAQALTAKRTQHANARLKERPLEQWGQVIAQIRASDFCCGKNDTGWSASFDWLLQPDVAVKVLEGKYDNKKAFNSNSAEDEKRRAASKKYFADMKARGL